jgi:hypothetical protein
VAVIVQLRDTEDSSNRLNGMSVGRRSDLLAILDELHNREPFFLQLCGENDYTLLLGIGGSLGCAQYSRTDGDPPYLMSLSAKVVEQDDCVEFLTGHTLTQVSRRYCVPFEILKQISVHFLESGERSPLVSWEEI